MLQERLYIPFKWALFLSFADVMCFFISIYLLVGVYEKCQNILFLLLKRREKRDFHSYYFSFLKQSFVEPHTAISEVYFNNREFHSLFFGVIFGVILNFMSTFSVYHLHDLAYLFIVLGFTLGSILGFTQSLGVLVIELVSINPCLYHLSLTIKYVLR